MILGNEALLERIQGSLNNGKYLHAFIICGPHGSGKKMLAKYLTKAAVCTGVSRPCRKCNGCYKADQGIHPDIETIVPEKGKVQVSVEQIRDLRRTFFTRTNESPRRVAIINDAKTLNKSGQNALLKVIEEPPAPVLIIFIAENENELLPTVLSRCAVLRMSPLSEDVIVRALRTKHKNKTEAEVTAAARKSGGYLGTALELLSGEDKSIASVSKISRALVGNDKYALLSSLVALEKLKRDEMIGVLEGFRRVFRDAAVIKCGRRGDYYPEEGKLLANKFTADGLLNLDSGCAKYMNYVDSNVSVAHVVGGLISLFSEERV